MTRVKKASEIPPEPQPESGNGGIGGWIGSWFRRTVPNGYQHGVLTLIGTAPLLMSCSEYDRDGELYRSFFHLGKKRGKSLDDEARLREMEWKLRLYYDDKLGPYIPDRNVHELLRQAATKWRKGEDVKRSLVVLDTRIPLLYEGPKDQQGLWDEKFKHEAMAANSGPNGGRVVRCRPKFEGWSLVAEIAYDPEDLDFDMLEMVVERAQKYGLGDWRPLFGSFKAFIEKGELHKRPSNGSAVKIKDPAYEAAHAAFRARITAAAE